MKKIKFLLFQAIILLFVISIDAQKQIKDTDGDTSVETERTANDDIIRFKVGGNDVFRIKGNRLEATNIEKNIFIGQNAGVTTTGSFNIGIGSSALLVNTTGTRNAGIGTDALSSNTTGNFNTGIGTSALQYNTTGDKSIGIGPNALRFNTTGSFNAGIGAGALFSNTIGTRNAGIGTDALRFNTTGSKNIGIGTDALRFNTTGSNNIGIGSEANYYNKTGNNNTIIGEGAGKGSVGVNKSGNVFIGFRAGFSETGSDKLYIENSTDVTTPLIYGDFASNQLAIGTSNPASGYSLSVNGKIISEEVRVLLETGWPDYVFQPNYKLKSLEEVDLFIKANGHLPNIPSAKEVEANGIPLGGMQKNLVEKIEELTLYMIDMNKQVKQLKAENDRLKKEVDSLKN